MTVLIELTLRGSLAALVVIAVDRAFAGRISASSRRWWWCFVPLAFLVPLRIPIFPAVHPIPAVRAVWDWASLGTSSEVAVPGRSAIPSATIGLGVWIAGAIAYLALVAIQTARAARRWNGERLSTDHALLELLEDCKAETGVSAPIGLVISASVPSPAILGWLRPRILLPAHLVSSASGAQLRPVLLHELAHFRWFDVPFNWLLTLVRALHWFNPFAHLGSVAWARYREEAADEAAVKWMKDDSGQAYGDALLQTLRHTRDCQAPFGAFAIVETVQHLKRRITMIKKYPNKSPHVLLVCLVSALLAAVVGLKTARASEGAPADPKAAAIASAGSWLGEIDAGNYGQSWKDASQFFQTHVSSDNWVSALERTRKPLGKCNQRTLASAVLQTDPMNNNQVTKGEFVLCQYETSFENLKHAVESVAVMKATDGSWKATGYFIHP